MKKILLCAGFLSIFNLAEAKPVNPQSAQLIALNFLSSKTSLVSESIQLIKSYGEKEALVYVFSYNQNQGFVIISGDDLVTPVLGYSLDNPFPAADISPEANYWLEGYADQIRMIVDKNAPVSNEIAQKWATLNAGLDYASKNKQTAVSPLMQTKWNQLPYYNIFCPIVPSGTPSSTPNAPAGCVATAMAQIMKFWDNPTVGTGSRTYSSSTLGGTLTANFGNTSYDWANMPRVLNKNSTTEQVEAVATLMYHCGIAVNMNYNAQASGAYVISYGNSKRVCSENALKNNFGYKKTIKGYPRNDYQDSNWINLLKFEIDYGRPLLYTGYGQLGGHAFVFDGYDNNNFFHINWGWGGMSDGYFIVNDLSPSALGAGGGSGNFNSNQEALIMIEPTNSTLPLNSYTNDYVPEDFALILANEPTSSADTIYFGSSYSVSVQIKNIGTKAFSNNNNLVIMALESVSQNEILIEDVKTSILPDSTYEHSFSTAKMDLLTPGNYKLTFTVLDLQKNVYTIINPNGANIVSLTVLPVPTNIDNLPSKKVLSIYPNPASELINIKLKSAEDRIQRIILTDIQGRVIFKRENISEKELHLKTETLPTGLYLINIQTNKGSFIEKVTIKK